MERKDIAPRVSDYNNLAFEFAFEHPNEEAAICLNCPLEKCKSGCQRYKTMHKSLSKKHKNTVSK